MRIKTKKKIKKKKRNEKKIDIVKDKMKIFIQKIKQQNQY